MTLEDIRNFIANQGYNYTWVARELEVSKYTVREWFASRRQIPPHRLRELEELVTREIRRKACPEMQVQQGIIAYGLSEAEMIKAKKEAEREGTTVEQYAKNALLLRLGGLNN